VLFVSLCAAIPRGCCARRMLNFYLPQRGSGTVAEAMVDEEIAIFDHVCFKKQHFVMLNAKFILLSTVSAT